MQQNIDDIKCNDMTGEAPAGMSEASRASGVWAYEAASNASSTEDAGMSEMPEGREGRTYGAASGAAPAGMRVLWGYDVGSHGDDGVIVGTPASSTWGDEASPTDPGITQHSTHQTHQANMGAIDPGATMPGATLPDAHQTHQANVGAADPGATMPGTHQVIGYQAMGDGKAPVPNVPTIPRAGGRAAASISRQSGGKPRTDGNDNDNRGLSPTRLNVEAATLPPTLGSSPAWSPRPVRLTPVHADFVLPMTQPVSPTARAVSPAADLASPMAQPVSLAADLVPPATRAVSSIAEFRSPTADLVSPIAQPVSSIAEIILPATELLSAAEDYSTQEMELEQANVPLASSATVAGRELTAFPRVDDARFQASYDEDGGQFRPGPPRPGSYGRPTRATTPLAGTTRRRTSGQLTRHATGTLAASDPTRRTSGQLTRRATSSLAAERARTSGPLPARATRSLAASERIGPSGHLAAAEWDEVQPARGERDTILLVLVALFILGIAGILGFGYLLSLSSVHLTSFLAG